MPEAVHTMQFSNHTGYGEFNEQVFSTDQIHDVLESSRRAACWPNSVRWCQATCAMTPSAMVILSAVQQILCDLPDFLYICAPPPRSWANSSAASLLHPSIPDHQPAHRRPARHSAEHAGRNRNQCMDHPHALSRAASATQRHERCFSHRITRSLTQVIALLQDAMTLAVSSLYALVASIVPRQQDLPLIAARSELISPSQYFKTVS